MPRSNYPLKTDTPKGRAAVLADATHQERELIATLEALDREHHSLQDGE